MVSLERAEKQLVLHEGLRLEPYTDTEGNETIAVGYNVTSRGWEAIDTVLNRAVTPVVGGPWLTRDEALRMLHVDIARVELSVRSYLGPECYDGLNEVRQRVCLDMAFNMGRRAEQFHRAILALQKRDWSAAAKEIYRSKWAEQVGDGEGGNFDRADRLAKMLLTGLDYTR